MASRTQMFALLRIIDQGASNADVIRAAMTCWSQLPAEIRQDMAVHGNADSRRARLWSVAWDSGQQQVEELRNQVHVLTGALTRAIASLDAGYPSEAIADLREVLP